MFLTELRIIGRTTFGIPKTQARTAIMTTYPTHVAVIAANPAASGTPSMPIMAPIMLIRLLSILQSSVAQAVHVWSIRCLRQ